MRITIADSIGDFDPHAWNALAGARYPFLRHEFLLAAESSGCASVESGWEPRHIGLHDASGQLVGVLPLYEKSHSWGEFVFDWSWAYAYERAGLPYYPKLVSAVPFTPAPSTRLLTSTEENRLALLEAAREFAGDGDYSSLHVLFPQRDELAALESVGFKLRKDCQFHWHNRDYRDFDEFLATFTSSKRKKARRDRRRVADAGIRFRRLRGAELDAETWDVVYAFIARTFALRGSLPYFNKEFFSGLSRELPDKVLVVLAEHESQPIAAAIFYESETTLYGRYWGSDGHYDALHFETCYYQGIEYCIETGKQYFEPGTQARTP
jgi:predicted N-acyltransferase